MAQVARNARERIALNDHPDTHALAQARAQLQREIAERQAVEARYQAQLAQLRAEQARLRELAEMSSEWFWEMDEELRFSKIYGGGLLVSPSCTEVHSPLGKRRWELPIAHVSPEKWTEHRQMLEARQPFKDFVYQIHSPLTGQAHWCSISGKPIFEDGVFKGYHGMGIDITERKQVEMRVEFLAYHDALTGLPNRALLQDRMQQAIAQAERAQDGLALAFIDLDNFKRINDSLGHAAGDALLREIATRLKGCVRESDTVSRQSGDEFILVLSGVDGVQRCIPTLDKIMRTLQEPMHFEGKEISASASIGVAFYPQDGTTFDELRKKADLAMYRSKDTGRNAYYFYDEAMNNDAEEHLLLRNGLRLAIERGELVLHYQPQMDIRSGRMVGVEALLRWQSPTFGLVEPGRFIPVAEDSGLIVPIGAWVLEQACRQARAWQDDGLPALTVAVNLSAVQFRRDDVEATVDQALERSGLPPHCLELELTESILLQDVEQVLALVQRLRQRGMHFSIDDFGTGYSSLAYLKRLDIDKLKIDRSFVHDLDQTADAAAIVEAIVEMAHKLGLRTIAEGVESPELLDRLRDIGCDEAQGYLHARPMPAQDFARYLHAHFHNSALAAQAA